MVGKITYNNLFENYQSNIRFILRPSKRKSMIINVFDKTKEIR